MTKNTATQALPEHVADEVLERRLDICSEDLADVRRRLEAIVGTVEGWLTAAGLKVDE